jgi:hypothetical protein
VNREYVDKLRPLAVLFEASHPIHRTCSIEDLRTHINRATHILITVHKELPKMKMASEPVWRSSKVSFDAFDDSSAGNSRSTSGAPSPQRDGNANQSGGKGNLGSGKKKKKRR